MLLVQPQALVAVAPEPGYLHQRTPLYTVNETAGLFAGVTVMLVGFLVML
jgi:hypothetical protein